jgi:nicotinamide-nucleotide amidase
MSPAPEQPPGTALAAPLQAALRRRGATIAVAESLTGGLLGAALTEPPGASVTFRGAVVAYATELKSSLLGVDEALLRRHGAVHPQVAAAMARGAASRLRATYGLAATGVAGPDPQDGRPPGEVHLAFAGPGAGPLGVAVRTLALAGDRAAIRADTVREAVAFATELLGKQQP